MASSTEHEPHGTHQTKKATASGWIGSALEYYDFFIYATAASLIFPQIFFPSSDPKVAIVASLATYGVGYVARPIGAFFLGHWGDTHGRKTVLLVCMFLMGFSTMAVGILPTYQQVGWYAPALLVVLRLIQGFAVAGEISGASSMILEHAPFGRRGFFASFTLQGVQAGQILAAAVFLPLAHYMPEDAFNSWGWRIPFLLSFVVIVAGYIIRREVEETPAFAEEGEHGEVPKAPIIQAITNSWRDMLRVVCMALMNVIPVVTAIFGAAYAVQPGYGIGFSKDVYLWIPVLGNILAVLVIPVVGNLSDKIGRKPPIVVGALAFGAPLVCLPVRHQHPQRAAGDRDVPADVGRRLPGLQRHLPELLPRALPDAQPGLGDGHLAEPRHTGYRPFAGAFRNRGAARLDQHPDDDRGDHLRHYGRRGDRRLERSGDLSDPPQRSRRPPCRTCSEGGVRPDAGADHCRRGDGQGVCLSGGVRKTLLRRRGATTSGSQRVESFARAPDATERQMNCQMLFRMPSIGQRNGRIGTPTRRHDQERRSAARIVELAQDLVRLPHPLRHDTGQIAHDRGFDA